MEKENKDSLQNEQQQSQQEEKKSAGFSWHNLDEYFQRYNRTISIIVGALIVLILAFWGYRKFIKEPRENKAAEDMYFAEYYFGVDSLKKALNGDGEHMGFLDIINTYPHTPSGNLAHFYAGVIYLKQGQYEDAIEHLKKFKKHGYIISAIAFGLLGDAYVELNDFDNAIKYYEKATKENKNQFTTPMYLLRLGLAYEEKGEWEKARECYEKIQKEYHYSYEARDIKRYIGRVEFMTENNNNGK